MRGLSLCKIETSVLLAALACISILLTFSQLAFAGSDSKDSDNDWIANARNAYQASLKCVGEVGGTPTEANFKDAKTSIDFARAYEVANQGNHQSGNTKDSKKFKSCIDRENRIARGGTDTTTEDRKTCSEATDKLGENFGKFVSACQAANMGSGSSCLRQAAKCQDCDPYEKRSKRKSHCKKVGGEIVDIAGSVSPFLFGGESVGPNPFEASKKFNQCPSYAGEFLDDTEEKIKEHRDNTNTLKSELADLEEGMNKRASDMRKTEQRIQEEIDSIEREVELKIEEIRSQEQKLKQELEDTVAKLLATIQQLELDIQNSSLTIQDLRFSMETELTQQRLECHRAASQKVTELQEEKKKLIAANLYSAGGFTNLIRNAGLDKTTRLKMLQEKYYRNCKKDRAFKESAKLIQKKFSIEAEKVRRDNLTKKKQIAQIKSEIKRMRARLPELLRELVDKLESFRAAANQKIIRLQQQLAGLREDSQRSQALDQQRYTDKQNELQREELFVRQRQAFSSVASMFAKGVPTEKGKADEAMGLSSTVLTNAGSVKSACGCCAGDKNVNPAACRQAYDYLKAYYSGDAEDIPALTCFNDVDMDKYIKGEENQKLVK